MNNRFSWDRLSAIIFKEFMQMLRDRLTFAMLIGIPLIQLTLFGFAINTNPKHLPMAIINEDISPYTRTFVSALQNTEYFKVINTNLTEKEGEEYLARNIANFIVHIPANFTRDLMRGDQPNLLISVDATDPIASVNAITSLGNLARRVFNLELGRGLGFLLPSPDPFTVIIHARYNPEAITQYNIVPALMGVVLTMTMVLITALAITRERERGTMEYLLSMPVVPMEVIIGKVIPYIIMGYLQVSLILITAHFVFQVPFEGSLLLLLVVTLPFIAANLTVGITLSTLAKNQLQAMQMAFFFFLPSILLSGFMFPIAGMPVVIQWLSQALPLTHFLIIVRGIILKGNSFLDIWQSLLGIIAITVVVVILGLKRFRRTLD